MTNKAITAALIITIIAALLLPPSPASAHDTEVVHPLMTDLSVQAAINNHQRSSQFRQEFVNQDKRGEWCKSQAWANLRRGSVDEDPTGLTDFYIGLHHGYNPYTNQGWSYKDDDHALNMFIKHFHAAVAAYPEDKEKAYYLLGRAIHLLQDITVPAHAHAAPHARFLNQSPYAGGDDPYELYLWNDVSNGGDSTGYFPDYIRANQEKLTKTKPTPATPDLVYFFTTLAKKAYEMNCWEWHNPTGKDSLVSTFGKATEEEKRMKVTSRKISTKVVGKRIYYRSSYYDEADNPTEIITQKEQTTDDVIKARNQVLEYYKQKYPNQAILIALKENDKQGNLITYLGYLPYAGENYGHDTNGILTQSSGWWYSPEATNGPKFYVKNLHFKRLYHAMMVKLTQLAISYTEGLIDYFWHLEQK